MFLLLFYIAIVWSHDFTNLLTVVVTQKRVFKYAVKQRTSAFIPIVIHLATPGPSYFFQTDHNRHGS